MQDEVATSQIATLFCAGFITLNVGLSFVFSYLNWSFFTFLFAIQWFLFAYLGSKAENHQVLYKVFSYMFFGLFWFVYLLLLFYTGSLENSTALIVLYIGVVIGLFYLTNNEYDNPFTGIAFLVSCYALIFSIYQYLSFFIESSPIRNITLSIMWLIFCLAMFAKSTSRSAKIAVGVLLGITLLKIAFNDLFYLTGGYRILGFILFGILLIIGGYVINNDSSNQST